MTAATLLAALAVASSAMTFECERFENHGGWRVEAQFRAQMGSSYLLAHGLGRPVADASTTFEISDAGAYRVSARTMNWTAPWSEHAAGRFRILVDGRELPNELGAGSATWRFCEAGTVDLAQGRHTLALHDVTGFDGRCDAIVIERVATNRVACCGGRGATALPTTNRQPRNTNRETRNTNRFDLVVCGGGIAGICTAVSAARLGLRVALVQDRPVLGGNNSSEVRVHLGAWQNMPPYPRLGDVLAEIAPRQGGNARDAATYEDDRKLAVVRAERNVSLFLNTQVDAAETKGAEKRLVAVTGENVVTGERIRFEAPLFADCTGDGTVGFLAGADYRMGREAKGETGEPWAPERPDMLTLGSSVQWNARTAQGETAFPLQPWMIRLTDENGRAELRGDWDWETGLGRDPIAEAERIRDYGLLVAYSNWAFAKNVSKKREAFRDKALAWVASVAGRRETRRLMGDFILSERHILDRDVQPDGTCAATWTIDLHFPKEAAQSKFAGEPFRTRSENEKIWPYPIPYRCYYSRNVANLFMAGRDISVTHVALGTTRLMRTHGMMGEVVGMAASLCRRHGCDPRAIYARHFDELKALMTRGVGDGRAHPTQMYNLQTSLDARFRDRTRGNYQIVAPKNAVAPKVKDVMRTTDLGNVRLAGRPGEKMMNFIRARILSPHAQEDIFGEARSAFRDRDDDERLVVDGKRVGGLWRGEFWGKLMLGTARVACYLRDPQLTAFVRDECRRMRAYQDADGYLGSYADRDNVAIAETNKPAMRQAYGWNTVWNVWNRKYAIWAMLMAYKATGDREILDSTVRQADALLATLRRLDIPLYRTGQPEKVGLPSMSILKPLLMLYCQTGRAEYLAEAERMLPDWDRADGECPNFFRNAGRSEPLWTWYPNPERWGKSYEMMSCLDGLVEHYRVTGSRRSLDAVQAIRENLVRTEMNALGDVGYVDQFYGAAAQPNAATEVCDTIHWIRLNFDLFLATGDTRYVDAMEIAYFNAFLAGVFRDGTWGAFAVRDTGRHACETQCGYAYNQCCVNNVPRTFMDVAESVVTADRKGTYHVNFYQDATVEMDGVAFEISGNYPVGSVVTVKVSKKAEVAFRKPGWCPKMTVDAKEEPSGGKTYTLAFEMPVRLVERPALAQEAPRKGWHYNRYFTGGETPRDILRTVYRAQSAATVMRGPILLAKSVRAGARRDEILDPKTVNGTGAKVSLEPIEAEGVWGAWKVTIEKDGHTLGTTRACDYQSAGDDPYGRDAVRFSIWF